MQRTSTLAAGLLAALILALGVARPGLSAPKVTKAQDPAAVKAASPPPAAAEAKGEHEAAHGQPNILEPQIPLAFWTLVVFLLLMAVLWRFAWGPLSKALHDREHFMEDTLKQAEHTRAESERLLAEHRRMMDQSSQQAQALLDDARRGALAAAEEIRRSAQNEAEATLQRAQKEIASARDQALLEIWNKSANLAVSVAGKVLARELRDEDHRRLVDEAMAELPVTPNGQAAGGLRS